MELTTAVRAYKECATAHRRALHRIPETGNEEFETQAYVLAALEKIAPDEVSVMAGTGVRAVFYAKDVPDAKCIAFRADMDALQIEEKSGCAFVSEHPGKMHACGHDGHTANLLTLAQYIADRREALACHVVLIFQPAEETTGGAMRMVEAGVLESPHVDEIYGMHLMPDIPLGQVGSCAGPLMASTTEIDFDIIGKSAHGAMPHMGTDAIAAAAHLLTMLQTQVARTVDPCRSALITVGRMEAGTQRNVLAAKAHLEGIIRTLSNDVYQALYARIEDCVRGMEAAFGVTCKITPRVYFPCVENDAERHAKVRGILGERYVPLTPRMIAEDFSYYQLKRPGVFVFCGCKDAAHHSPLHSDTFDFDEEAMLYGLELFTRLIQWRA